MSCEVQTNTTTIAPVTDLYQLGCLEAVTMLARDQVVPVAIICASYFVIQVKLDV